MRRFSAMVAMSLLAGAGSQLFSQPATRPAGRALAMQDGSGNPSAASQPATRPAPIYIDPVTGFSIVPPKFADSPQRMVVFYAPAQNDYAATMNIHVDPIKTTRQSYRDMSMRALQGRPNLDVKVNSSVERTVGGADAQLLDYEATIGARRLRFLQMLVIGEDAVYILTCESPAESFAQYADAFMTSLNSFRVPKK